MQTLRDGARARWVAQYVYRSAGPTDWRVFLETAFALIDILDAELQAERKITLIWYDALVHLEDAKTGSG